MRSIMISNFRNTTRNPQINIFGSLFVKRRRGCLLYLTVKWLWIYEAEQVSDGFQIVIEVSISLRPFLSLYITEAQYQPNPLLDTIHLTNGNAYTIQIQYIYNTYNQ